MMKAIRRSKGYYTNKVVELNNNEELKAFIESETDFIKSNRGYYFTEIYGESGNLIKSISYNHDMQYIVRIGAHRLSKAF